MKQISGYAYHQTDDFDGRLWKMGYAHQAQSIASAPLPSALAAVVRRLLTRNRTWEIVVEYSRGDSCVICVGNEAIGRIQWSGGKYLVSNATGTIMKRTVEEEQAIAAAELHCFPETAQDKWKRLTAEAFSALERCRVNHRGREQRLYGGLCSAFAEMCVTGVMDASLPDIRDFLAARTDFEAADRVISGPTTRIFIDDRGMIWDSGYAPVALDGLPEKIRAGLAMLKLMPDRTVADVGFRFDDQTFIVLN